MEPVCNCRSEYRMDTTRHITTCPCYEPPNMDVNVGRSEDDKDNDNR